jgi:hypothetical protein
MIDLDAKQVPLAEREDLTKWPPCDRSPLFRASTTMLSRLAEAVDGHRRGEPVCYVGRFWYDATTEGHRLFGPFSTCEEARDFRRCENLDPGEYGIFGPFYTKKETDARARGGRTVERVVVHFSDKTELCLDGQEFDAVFWSASSLEKFVIPYYVSIGTVAEGDILADVAQNFELLTHRPGSIWQTESTARDEKGKPLGVGLYALSPDGGAGTFKARLATGGDDR